MKDLGKVNRALLHQLFVENTGAKSEAVIQGPHFGVDTAVIDMGNNKGIAVASDPLSLIPPLGIKESAWLSVILPANDLATTGYLPQFAQFVLNLPYTMTNQELEEYWTNIHFFCKEIGIAITGGHTGFDKVEQTTIVGGATMFSVVDLSKVKNSSLATPGQDLLLTKSAAISSAAILSKSFPNYTRKKLGENVQNFLAESFYWTGVIPEVRILKEEEELLDKVSAMHDVTEGGVLGGIYELCEASNVGVNVDEEKILVGNEQRQICDLFRIDPLRSIGAGSLLIACQKEATLEIIALFRENGIAARKIGETLHSEKGKKIKTPKGVEMLDYQESDPYWAAFADAIKQKLD